MKNRYILNKLFEHNRKLLYMILGIIFISILTLTIVYAALSTTLNINGQAEVSAASWDIHLANVKLNSESATSNKPTIIDQRTATFTTTLNKPGDFYEFTIDVVNNGSIDAMIDSITKTPELSSNQKKYLNYIVEYQNGEPINNKQLVSKKTFVKLKIKIGFRSDISASDLPTEPETLNLSFKVNYIQADETGTTVKDDGVFKLNIVSGNLETVGSEVVIGDEHFYIISSNNTSVTMLTKYNLYVGGKYESYWIEYGEEATGIQNPTMTGYQREQSIQNGTTKFASTTYWSSTVSSYPAYVYGSNSSAYSYIENYKTYLESKGAVIEEARLIKTEELETLGCNRTNWNCNNAPSWVYATSYWTGNAESINKIYAVNSDNAFGNPNYATDARFGVRPVITITR